MSASTLLVSHDQRKRELMSELNIVLKAAVAHRRPTKEPLNAELTANLCSIVEAMFIHGLRDPFFLRGSRYAKYPEPNFWPFVSKFTHRSITTQIQALNQIKSEIGRSRAWIRLVLNEGGLEHHLCVLIAEKKALAQFYQEEAFIRDNDHIERAKDLFKGLNGLTIAAPTNSALMNTWTPSPLILAGLVEGKPLRVGQHATHRRVSSKENDRSASSSPDETGICALELLPSTSLAVSVTPPTTSVLRSSASPRVNAMRPSPHRLDEDDNSSVYSHPSMVADHLCAPSTLSLHPPAATVPLVRTSNSSISPSSFMMIPAGGAADALVQRRTKRRRNMSRSSSDSQQSASGSGQQRRVGAAAAGAPTISAADEPIRPTVDSTPEEEQLPMEGETERQRKRCETAADSGVESEVAILSVGPTLTIECVTEHEKELIDNQVFDDEEEPDSGLNESMLFEMSVEAAVFEEQLSRVEEGTETRREDSEADDVTTLVEKTTSTKEDEETGKKASMTSVDEDLRDSFGCGNSLIGRSWMTTSSRYSDYGGVAGRRLEDVDSGSAIGRTPSSTSSPRRPRSDDVRLSSSSDTDNAVSFGAALRQHIERQEESSSLDDDDDEAEDALNATRKRDFDDSTEEEEDQEALEAIRREAEQRATLTALTEIACEAGLDAQEFRCTMCKTTIGVPPYRKYNVCSLDARYYCCECWQQGADKIVPSRLVLNWDTRAKKISPRSNTFLETVGDKPLIHIDQVNMSLYAHSTAMREVKELRERLQLVSLYLLNCRESVAADLRRRLAPKEYLIDDIHLYSYNDLLSVVAGSMARQLKLLLKFATGHVFSCTLCSQKGFVCEMCNEGSVIYPFQTDITHRCPDCYSVCHLHCFERTHECVKCERRRHYLTARNNDDLAIDC